MDDDLGKLPQVIRLAKKTVRIARQNMTLAIVVKLIFLVLSGLGISNMWEAIFCRCWCNATGSMECIEGLEDRYLHFVKVSEQTERYTSFCIIAFFKL